MHIASKIVPARDMNLTVKANYGTSEKTEILNWTEADINTAGCTVHCSLYNTLVIVERLHYLIQ